MAFFVWSDKYSVGVREFDAQHQQLVKIMNELFDAMSSNKAKDVLGKILGELVTYTKTHFSNEERYMQTYAYPGLADQKREHEAFVKKIQDFHTSFNAGKLALSIEMSSFLKNWLIQHISGTDRKYQEFFNAKGVK